MRSRLNSTKPSSLLTKSELRNSSHSNTDLSTTSRRSNGAIPKPKKSGRLVLNCGKLTSVISPRAREKANPISFKPEVTKGLGFEDAEQDSVLLELADLLSVFPTKPRVRTTQRTVASEGLFKNTTRSAARLKPLKPIKFEKLISPSLIQKMRVKSSRTDLGS
jgi:hypothetical protein